MRLLRVLGLVLVHARAFGDVIGPVSLCDGVAGGHNGLGRHVDPVGAHVGDVSRLVEALRSRHALLGAHAELAARLLLQGRGHERRGRGCAWPGFAVDRRDGQGARRHRLHRHLGLRGVLQIVLVELGSGQRHQPRLEFLSARRGQSRLDRPVFAGVERLDLHLALDDQPQAHRLHATRRFRARKLAPEHRAEVEAHKIVQRAAREIGLDQRGVDGARVLHRLGHRRFGDRVEHHARHRGVLPDRLALAQRLFEMPADRLALAVGVGGENEGVVVLQRVGDRLDVLAAVSADLPCHVEAVLGIDRSVLGRQVAHVAVACQNRVVVAQILVDRLGFGRRFDNNNGHGQSFRP